MTNHMQLIDQLLDEARKKGLYNPDIPGERALEFADTTHVHPDDRVAYQLLYSNGFAPPFIEERSQLLHERIDLNQLVVLVRQRYSGLDAIQKQTVLSEMRRKLTDLWRRTLDYNLIAPTVLQIDGIRVEYELTRMQEPISLIRSDSVASAE